MVDRLDELKGGCSTSDIEMGAPSRQQAGGASGFMAVFFQEVNEVKAAMCTIRANIARIEAHHGEALGAISAEQGKAATAKLEQEMGGTNALAKKVRSQLKAMDGANKLFAKKNPGASEARIRTNMHATLTRKFVDLMAEYQEVQTRYKSKYRERVERQYRIVKPTVTQDEIDAALDGDPSNQPEIFTQTILQGPGHAQAKHFDLAEPPSNLGPSRTISDHLGPPRTISGPGRRRATRWPTSKTSIATSSSWRRRSPSCTSSSSTCRCLWRRRASCSTRSSTPSPSLSTTRAVPSKSSAPLQSTRSARAKSAAASSSRY